MKLPYYSYCYQDSVMWEVEIKYKEGWNILNYLEMRNRWWYHWLCCHAFVVLSMMKREMDLLSICGEKKSFNFMFIIEIMFVHLRVHEPYGSPEKFASSNTFIQQHLWDVMHNSWPDHSISLHFINRLHHYGCQIKSFISHFHTYRKVFFLPAGPVV